MFCTMRHTRTTPVLSLSHSLSLSHTHTHTHTHTHPDRFLPRQKFKKSRKRTTPCKATSLLLTNWQKLHFMTICTFCRVLLNRLVDYLQNIKANVVASWQRQHFEPLLLWTLFVSLVNPSNRSWRFHVLKCSTYTKNTKPSCINYTDPLVYVHNFWAFRPLKRGALRWGIRNPITQRLFPVEPDPPRETSAPAIRITYHQNMTYMSLWEQ